MFIRIYIYVHIARFCWKIGGGIGGKGLKLDIAATGHNFLHTFASGKCKIMISLPSLIRFLYH